MADEDLPKTKYEVAAFLRLKGNFQQQMNRAVRGVPRVSASLQRMGRMAEAWGQRMQGSMQGAVRAAKMMGLIVGTVATAGMFNLARGGAAFAYQMEQAQLNIATMYQLFGQAQNALGGAVSEAEAWHINLALAERTMKSFMKLQRETPAGAADLVTIYQNAASGLAQTGAALARQEKFITTMSLLGPALGNDFRQIGADISRMLTGGAGLDVRTWTILRTQIAESAKELGLIKKGLTDNDAITKAWNKNLTQAQKLEVLEKAMSSLGPEIKKTFGESMGGLITTTQSNLKVLKRALMQPLYDGFRAFLEYANSESSAVFGRDAMEEWRSILGYFGTVAQEAAINLYAWIFKAARYLQQNWALITEYIKDGFKAGVFILKALIAKAIFSAVMSPLARILGKGLGVAGGAAGLVGGAARGALGGVMQFVAPDLKGIQAFLANLAVNSIMAAASLAILIPTVLALGAAAGAVTVIVGGMAAYIVEHWNSIRKMLVTNIDLIRESMRKVVIAGLRLWVGLVAIGEAFLGGRKSVDFMTNSLDFLAMAIRGVAGAVKFFIEVAAFMVDVVGGLKIITAELRLAFAHMQFARGKITKEELAATPVAISQGIMETVRLSQKLKNIAERFGEIQEEGAPEITEERVTGMANKLTDALLNAAAQGIERKAVPTSGVSIGTQYNNWDLRDTDPDRVMMTFLPKMAKLADKRNQPYNTAVEQGV